MKPARAGVGTHILHNALCLLDLADKVVLLGLNLGTGLLAQSSLIVWVKTASLNLALFSGLGAVEHESAVLDIAACLCGKLNVGVEGSLPTRQEARLDLLVLGQSGFTNFLLS